jgi:hypothetical protein
MPWYAPVIMLPSIALSCYFGLRAINERAKGADTLNLLLLGLWAREDSFTPRGRRYRLWSLLVFGGGLLLTILIYLLTSIGPAA